MTTLLVIIYVAFISLGLPDSLLGSAWPNMYEVFGVTVSSAGIVSMIIAGGTIISSLLCDRVVRRIGTGLATLVSVAMTAVALLGFSFASSFGVICLWAIPLGLGAGCVDAALNNFVALHYKASQMSWLHCFWGIGASVGPVILSAFLVSGGTWHSGYRAVSVIQFALVGVLAVSLPLWRKAGTQAAAGDKPSAGHLSAGQMIKMPGAKATLLSFFCYCGIEATVGLWGSTYLVVVRGIGADKAASWISLFYMGITVGRLLSGFITARLRFIQLVRLGQGLIGLGIVVILLPFSQTLLVGFFLVGLGCAPIYPALLHETPRHFGEGNSQAMMGVQMACAYVGSTFLPPLFGALGKWIGYGLLPFYAGALLLLMVVMVQRLYVKLRAT